MPIFGIAWRSTTKSEYLWAAEQVSLGGWPPGGNVPPQYQAAYNKRLLGL